MKKIRSLITLGLAAACASTLVAPSHAVTRTYVDAGEIGQGFLVKRLDTCYLVTPAHVVGDALFANITVNSPTRALGEGSLVETFGYDLSLLSVTGSASRQCVDALSQLDPGKFSELVMTSVLVGSVNADGSLSSVPVDVTDVGLQYLRVRTRDSNSALYKGMSGSLVTAGASAVGMLQSVDSETGEGVVLRMDRVIDTLRPFFQVGAVENQAMPVASTAVSGISTVPLAWSEQAIDKEHRLGNLFDGDPATDWVAPFREPPFIVEAQIGVGEAVTVNGITLVQATGDRQENRDQPKDFEVQVSLRAEGNRGWNSIYGGTWLRSEPEKAIRVAPVKAKRIRIVLHSNWGADTVGIGEILVQ